MASALRPRRGGARGARPPARAARRRPRARGRAGEDQHGARPAAAAAQRPRPGAGVRGHVPHRRGLRRARGRATSPPRRAPCPIRCPARSTATRSPTRRSWRPTWPARGVHTLTLFGLHTPARLFAGDRPGAEAVRDEAARRHLAGLDAYLAEPIADCLARDAEGRPCVEAVSPLRSRGEPGPARRPHLPRRPRAGRGPPTAGAGEARTGPADAQPGAWGVETDVANLFVCGAGARRGGGVSGIGGHNAAMAVLARAERNRTGEGCQVICLTTLPSWATRVSRSGRPGGGPRGRAPRPGAPTRAPAGTPRPRRRFGPAGGAARRGPRAAGASGPSAGRGPARRG